MGIAYVAQEGEADDDDEFEIWPENWETFSIFMRMQRRWVRGAMGGEYLRLDDQAILAQFEIYQVKKKQRAGIMDDLLAMEEAALEVLNAEK